jgi:predicted ATPase
MYHDDREITAEKLIETLEVQVMKLTDLPDEARLVLMVVLAARFVEPSFKLQELSDKLLLETSVLASITAKTFDQLLFETQRIAGLGDDTTYLLTHLTAKLISSRLGIDYRHPKLVAAFVGTVQSTLSTPLFEAMPNTAELSLGLLGTYSKDSFPMFGGIPERQRDLISIRLAAINVRANFTPIDYRQIPQSTVLLDAPYSHSPNILLTFENVLKNHVQGRLVLIQNWARAETADNWQELLAMIKDCGEIEAIINFSSLPTTSDQCTAIIVNTTPAQHNTLYIDVSISNKSLPPLDGIERMLLAGCIYNLWQGRLAHSNTEYLSDNVSRFLNSYFSEGFRPISGLCNAVDKRPKTISKNRLISRAYLKAAPGESSRPTQTNNSSLIRETLERRGDRCCVYVIGNNGEGKSFLLRDIVYQLEEAQKRSIGLPMSHADRFPVTDKSINRFFEYKGARKTQIVKEVGIISSQPRKIGLLSECLEVIGFGVQIYLTLKSELSHDRFGEPRRKTLDLGNEDDMGYLNSDRASISKYEVNFIRKGHRTVPFDNLSSGEQSILSLLIKIIASDADHATFLIDEPEISLHVSWQQMLPRILSLLSSRLNASFVVATHSPILIANAAGDDICYVSRIGRLSEIPVAERHSVETLLMDGFETYTPHNREVHERCAKLVASLISAANKPEVVGQAKEAIAKLETFKATIEKNSLEVNNERQANDLDLVEKTIGAISMLRDESRPRNG